MHNWCLFVVLIFILDRGTKVLATLYLNDTMIAVLPGFNLILQYNEGAAFSLLSNQSGWQRWFFIVIGVMLSGYFIWWLNIARRRSLGLSLGLSLIIAGAVGNLYDRIFLGRVIDFIDIYYQQWHWPTFNIADTAICIGGMLLVVFYKSEKYLFR